jgi:hypothetical protein
MAHRGGRIIQFSDGASSSLAFLGIQHPAIIAGHAARMIAAPQLGASEGAADDRRRRSA